MPAFIRKTYARRPIQANIAAAPGATASPPKALKDAGRPWAGHSGTVYRNPKKAKWHAINVLNQVLPSVSGQNDCHI